MYFTVCYTVSIYGETKSEARTVCKVYTISVLFWSKKRVYDKQLSTKTNKCIEKHN